MAKKASVDSAGSNELSRLLTRARLQIAGINASRPAGQDPDLEQIFERVRSVSRKGQPKTAAVNREVVQKLA